MVDLAAGDDVHLQMHLAKEGEGVMSRKVKADKICEIE